ncbi:MAG TPA: 30S ribosomal protein S16 [Burkholderiaceae bacterium]|nr:30S ribosomal protein S16 [Burkholderiaceae bacterium]
MVVLRLSRGGAKHRPFYSIVATSKRSRRDGRFIERVGYYNPIASGNEQPLRISMDRVKYWTDNGAQVSEAVDRLIKQFAEKEKAAAAAAA